MKHCISLIVILTLWGCSPDSYTTPYFDGANSEGKMAGNPYLTPGDKSYVLGTQNGLFPDMGSHVRGEMGGIWAHPIKLADGFWLRVSNAGSDDGVWLADIKDYVTYPHGNKFIYQPVSSGIEVERFQFVPDGVRGVIMEYTLTNRSNTMRELDIDFLLKTDISPVWLAREIHITDHDDTVERREEEGVFAARDSDNDRFAVWGSSEKVVSWSTGLTEPYPTIGKGKTGMIRNTLKLVPEKSVTLTYAIAGSTYSDAEALATYRSLLGGKETLLEAKKRSFEEILARSKITIPDKRLETAYNWVKMNTRWLEMDLEGYGRFLGAGAIEYPWLFGCDNSYALQGVLAAGDFELAKSTLTILRDVSDRVNGNGQIIHEMSTNGTVYNQGNTQETAHFIVCVWEAFKWTGDLEFLRDLYPYVKKGLNWLLVDQDINQNMFPEGYGIMEVSGLNAELIDVAVYTQQALEAVSQMAILFGENDMVGDCRSKAAILKDKINNLFWDEQEGIYCDFFGTRDQALQVTRGAIEQLGHPWSIPDEYKKAGDFYNTLLDRWGKLPRDIERGWFTNKNWVINTPMETGIAPEARAIRTLDIIRNEHCGEWGPYLSAVEGKRMMTIATGVQAMSEARYGRINECLWYMDRIASTLGLILPGSITEMMPDSGCPVQAWTIYGMTTPLIRYVFGINPDAYNKRVVIHPQLPTGWDSMRLENQRIGNNTYNISIDRADGRVNIIIHSAQKDWQTILKIENLKEARLNGKQMIVTGDEITLQGSKNMISYRY